VCEWFLSNFVMMLYQLKSDLGEVVGAEAQYHYSRNCFCWVGWECEKIRGAYSNNDN